MGTKPNLDSADDVRGDIETFTSFMQKLMSVPQSEVKAAMEEEKKVKAKPLSSFRVRNALSQP